MKKHNSSSKKKRLNFIDQRSGEETVTPRVKKSYSVTNTNYLQLQLDTSSKKRQNNEKNLQVKEKRIRDLEREVKEQQEYITRTVVNSKELRHKWEHQKHKNQRLQYQWKCSVQLCRDMKDKCKQMSQENQNLKQSELSAKNQLNLLHRKYKDVKEARKRQKHELRELILPLLAELGKGNSLSSQEMDKLSKVL